jgi:hypothetical protein
MLLEPISMPASLIENPLVPAIGIGAVCIEVVVLTCHNGEVKLVFTVILVCLIAIADMSCLWSWGGTLNSKGGHLAAFAVSM